MFAQLEELVGHDASHDNFIAIKYDIMKIQEQYADKIDGNIVNEWMFQSLIKAYSSSSLFSVLGSRFAKGQYNSASLYLKTLLLNLRAFGQ